MVRLIDLGLDKLHNLIDQMIDETYTIMNEIAKMKEIDVKKLDEKAKRTRNLKDEVHDLAIEIIARYQPLASDLRDLKAAMEISYGLFRITRYIRDIGYAIIDSQINFKECENNEILKIMEVVKEMLSLSLRAYRKKDDGLANKVIQMDKIVDDAFREFLRKAVNSGKPCDVVNLLILRSLERLADHCVYIAESTLFAIGKRTI